MNERSTEGEGACWEGVEMTCTLYTLVHMVCGIRVRTAVMGLDPPQSTCTSIINNFNHDGPSHLPQEVQLNCSGNGKRTGSGTPGPERLKEGNRTPGWCSEA